MKIAVFGGTGMIGSRIVTEATGRGHEVTSLSRATGDDMADAATVDRVARDHDVIVCSTHAGPTARTHQAWLASIRTLIDHAGDARVVFVGGAGSLLLPDGRLLIDGDGFPPEHYEAAASGVSALELFRAAPEAVDWTFFCPAPEVLPGERTGRYVTALDTPAGDVISAEDYALALVDEIEEPRHRRARFTAAGAA